MCDRRRGRLISELFRLLISGLVRDRESKGRKEKRSKSELIITSYANNEQSAFSSLFRKPFCSSSHLFSLLLAAPRQTLSHGPRPARTPAPRPCAAWAAVSVCSTSSRSPDCSLPTAGPAGRRSDYRLADRSYSFYSSSCCCCSCRRRRRRHHFGSGCSGCSWCTACCHPGCPGCRSSDRPDCSCRRLDCSCRRPRFDRCSCYRSYCTDYICPPVVRRWNCYSCYCCFDSTDCCCSYCCSCHRYRCRRLDCSYCCSYCRSCPASDRFGFRNGHPDRRDSAGSCPADSCRPDEFSGSCHRTPVLRWPKRGTISALK